MNESTVNVRYMVADVAAAADWYVETLGFSRLPNASPAFAAVERGALRLLLSGPASSAGRPMPDGRQPVPGGWTASSWWWRTWPPTSSACAAWASRS